MCHNVTEIDISWADSDFCIWFVVNFAIYKYAFQAVWRRPRRPVKEAVAPLKKKSQSEPPFPNPQFWNSALKTLLRSFVFIDCASLAHFDRCNCELAPCGDDLAIQKL